LYKQREREKAKEKAHSIGIRLVKNRFYLYRRLEKLTIVELQSVKVIINLQPQASFTQALFLYRVHSDHYKAEMINLLCRRQEFDIQRLVRTTIANCTYSKGTKRSSARKCFSR